MSPQCDVGSSRGESFFSISLVEGAEGGEWREFSILTAWWIKLLENLVVPSTRGQDAEQIVSGVGCITHNDDCLVGQAGGIYVFQGGEWCTNDPSSYVQLEWAILQASPVVVSAAPAPHSDTAGENALNGSPAEHGYNGWWRSHHLLSLFR